MAKIKKSKNHALVRLATLYDSLVKKYGKSQTDLMVNYVTDFLTSINDSNMHVEGQFTFNPNENDPEARFSGSFLDEGGLAMYDRTFCHTLDTNGDVSTFELADTYEFDYDDEDYDDDDSVEVRREIKRYSKEERDKALTNLINSRRRTKDINDKRKQQERAYLLGKDEFSEYITDAVSNDSSKYEKTFVDKKYNEDAHKLNNAAIERNITRVAESMKRSRQLNHLINKYSIHDLLAISLKCIYEAAEYLTNYSVNSENRLDCAAELICCARYNINKWCEEEKSNHCMSVDPDVYSFAHKSCDDNCLLEAALVNIFTASCAPSTDICDIYINAAFMSLTDVEKQLRGIDPKDVLNNVI